MAHINADRIKETTTTTGTGAIALAGAVVGFRSFLAAPMANNDTCSYVIVSATGLAFETGIGTFTSPSTLARTTVQSSSNANAAVNFGAGSKDVFIGPTAGTLVPYDPVTGALGLSSLSFPSSTTNVTASVNNLALSASAFRRINCTTASSITGIAPPSGGTHTDGRMLRAYNVGTASLTLTHNSGSSASANRIYSTTAADIVLGANDYAELIYDSTSNGSGAAGWRAS